LKSPYKINLALSALFLLGMAIVLLTVTNKDLFIAINSFAAISSPFIWANITFLGDTLTACAIMLLFIRRRPDLVWSGLIATLIATLIVNIIKMYYDIPRPPAVIDKEQIHIIGPALFSRSFPSGHTVTIFTLAGILMFCFRSAYIRIGLILIALMVGISRIAVGVHWPADVLAGAALGILCATVGVYIVKKLGWNRIKPLQLIFGLALISSNVYLLFFYDSKYEQAKYLQTLFAFSVLVAGIREYYFLLKEK
jgi:membrane-associated phospholipid phosphatase